MLWVLTEVVVMSTHSISVYKEVTKIILQSSNTPFTWSSVSYPNLSRYKCNLVCMLVLYEGQLFWLKGEHKGLFKSFALA